MKSGIHPIAMAAALETASGGAQAQEATRTVRHQHLQVAGANVFYREAGRADAPAVLLLHGFGASSHMFRALMPALADRYHVLAPDLPGFGMTSTDAGFTYDFDRLADVIEAFADAKGLQRYAIYVFDYGAPVGWRLALRHPERISAIVSQNGNAYEEGLSPGWAPMRAAWADPTPANLDALRTFNTLEMTRWQYLEGVPDPARVAPDGWLLAYGAIERIGVQPQVDLLADYGSNVALYPQVQAYFRSHQPPTLAIWGRNDPFFLPPGAEAFRRDNPKAEVRFLDTGHFALETHGPEVTHAIREFLDRHLAPVPA